MEFRFHCYVIRHTSTRVTVLPLGVDRFAVHALSSEKALEDLTLALDDQISRVHPRHIADLPPFIPSDVVVLEPEVLPVWSPDTPVRVALTLTAFKRPAHGPYVEIRIPRLDMSLWFKEGDDVVSQATALVTSVLLKRSPDELLGLRREQPEELLTLTVNATPSRLSLLTPKEMLLDERPPPRAPDEDDEEDTLPCLLYTSDAADE